MYNEGKYFLTQIQRSTEGVYTKGVVVKDSLDAALQSFHAYFGAYAYGNQSNIDFVECFIADMNMLVVKSEVWNNIPEPEPAEEPEAE